MEASSLFGKKIIFLGSSVTYGSAAKGQSFVELLAKSLGIVPIKEAVSGTTIVDKPSNNLPSYIQRMKALDTSMKVDLFVCQLGTNDAAKNYPLGNIAADSQLSSFDTQTITGAIEYILRYVKNTWDCPTVFYTGTRYDNQAYGAMVKRLYQLQQKWPIGILDLWNDPDMYQVSPYDYARYMADPIHPTAIGYAQWWTPKFEEFLGALPPIPRLRD